MTLYPPPFPLPPPHTHHTLDTQLTHQILPLSHTPDTHDVLLGSPSFHQGNARDVTDVCQGSAAHDVCQGSALNPTPDTFTQTLQPKA
jgi:hypothetical protein